MAIESATTCPTAADVEIVLRAMSRDAEVSVPERVRVAQNGEQLVIELSGEDGQILATKELPAAYDCEVLAKVVAVTIASWRTEFMADLVPPSPSTAADEASAAPSSEAVAASEATSRAGTSSASEEDAGIAFETSLALGAAWDGVGDAATVQIGGGLRFGLWGVGLGLRHEFEKSLDLEGGRVRFQRPTATLWLSARSRPSLLSGEFGLGSGLSFVQVWGSGYDTIERTMKPLLALESYGRLYFFQSQFRPFLQGQVSWWPTPQRAVLDVSPTVAQVKLPETTGVLLVGFHVAF